MNITLVGIGAFFAGIGATLSGIAAIKALRKRNGAP